MCDMYEKNVYRILSIQGQCLVTEFGTFRSEIQFSKLCYKPNQHASSFKFIKIIIEPTLTLSSYYYLHQSYQNGQNGQFTIFVGHFIITEKTDSSDFFFFP